MDTSLRFSPNIKLSLIFNSFTIVGDWWNFKEVISPFSRIYLITEGEGWIYTKDFNFHLTPGKLCLIPKFTLHAYHCTDKLGQYYVCFFDEMFEGTGMYDLFEFGNIIDADPDVEKLFQRLNELNPHGNIINPDPAVFEKKETIHSYLNRTFTNKISSLLEIQGILLQLISRFISDNNPTKTGGVSSKARFSEINIYIDQNIERKITLKDLASQLFLSEDYFSKIFYETMGIRPIEYINRKRIEKAQTLLITTGLSIAEIAQKVGIPNNAYFSTIFKKHTHQTPEEYKKSYRWL